MSDLIAWILVLGLAALFVNEWWWSRYLWRRLQESHDAHRDSLREWRKTIELLAQHEGVALPPYITTDTSSVLDTQEEK